MTYDVCIVSFSDIKYDARTINLYNLCKKIGLNCLLISTSSNINSIKMEGDNIVIPIKSDKRVIYNWFYFLKDIKKIMEKIYIKSFWASDLYALPAIQYINNRNKVNIVYDSREIYSALSTLSNHRIKQYVITKIERFFIKKTTQIVVSGDLDKDYIKKFYNLDLPIHVVYNYPWAHKVEKTSLIRDKYNIQDEKIILIYQGVILKGRGLLPIIKSIRNSNDYVLVVLGDGKYKKELITYCNNNNLNDKVFFADNIQYNELYRWTSCGDIGLCNIEPLSQSYIYALPNKLFEYFQSELPVIVTDLPALAQLVRKYNCGEVVGINNDENEIIDVLNKIKDNYQYYKDNVKIISEKYHYETQIDLIKQILKI
ncbi:MAG: glycosyltransferase [Bacteroidetes bacterium]|nr:glycosyltransferase [Bacteroidota bacterium]